MNLDFEETTYKHCSKAHPRAKRSSGFLLTTRVPTNFHCWLFLCGIMFRVRVRLKVFLTRLTLGVLHAFDGHIYMGA